jgi:hypothetical protein
MHIHTYIHTYAQTHVQEAISAQYRKDEDEVTQSQKIVIEDLLKKKASMEKAKDHQVIHIFVYGYTCVCV